MQTGEIIVARLSGGISTGLCLEPTNRDKRVRISVGRNREALIPAERVMLATGTIASGRAEAEEFHRRCGELASDIDLAEVWEVAQDETAARSLDDLSDLYWGASHGAAQRVALLLHLEQTSRYFTREPEGYTPRSRQSLEETETRRQRDAENAHDAADLLECLSGGKLPDKMTLHQISLVEHLRGYAIHGDNYTRSAVARGLLEKAEHKLRDLQQLCIKLLEEAGIFSPDEPLELERAGIPDEFQAAVLVEAASIDLTRALGDPARRDLTNVPTLTVDDAGAQDRDDAISLEVEQRSSGQDGVSYVVGLHIADAGSLISQCSALDQEADHRMGTVYMPDRKIPMLPAGVSSELGSLLPGERRVALSVLVRVSESAELLGWEVVPSVVLSRVALSYDEADGAMEDVDDPWHEMLAGLDRIAGSLRTGREASGAINIERPEMLIEVPSTGEVGVKVISRSNRARLMVSEFMILCNSLLAEYCRHNDLPAPYRTQAVADPSIAVDEVPEGPLRWFLTMRSLQPAELNTVPASHSGLAVPAYIQATSPLRRYPDLVMQRQISHFIHRGEVLYSPEDIKSIAQRADVQLRDLARLEEERKQYWFLKYLGQRYLERNGDDSAVLQAVVLETRPRRAALLELSDYPYRTRAHLQGTWNPGETVTLRLRGVDLWRRVAQFVHEGS